MKKLELKNLKVSVLSKEEKSKINGGLEQEEVILSIGKICSLRNSCERVCGGPIAGVE